MLLDELNPKFKMNRRVRLDEINPLLICVLCGGYYVDATTIIECVHSFCRSCIVKHLESSKYCPICEVMVHKTKPLMNIRRDKTLQDIVYKLVPGMFDKEMQNRRQFYKDLPHYLKPEDDADAGEEVVNAYVPDDSINLSLTDYSSQRAVWYIKCPIGVTIQHLKKLILGKFGFKEEKVYVEIMLKSHYLDNELTLLEISCLHPWRGKEIIELSYKMLAIDLKEPVVVKTEDVKPAETDKPSEVIEKEVQLQITESGVMRMSQVDSKQDNDLLNQIIASSLPVPVPVTEVPKTEPPPKKVVVEKIEEVVKEGPKRPSTDGESSHPKKITISHSVQNMVANPAKVVKNEQHVKIPQKPSVSNNETKLPLVPRVAIKLDTPTTRANSVPAIAPYVPQPRIDKPKPVRLASPQPWRPVVPKISVRPSLTTSVEPRKPAKTFKNRNTPRFLGNPASGVKPLYSNGLAETPPASPTKKIDTITRIDPKTLRPVEKEEKKAPTTLMTSPFIPRDKHMQLPDPKTQPYSNISFPPGYHTSLPPAISSLIGHKPYRSVKIKEDANTSCDNNESRSASASNSKPEPEPPSASLESSKC